MQLQNPFTLNTRLLYLDCWTCWICGSNGQSNGGLEIHHITGRDSNSPFNSSCLCGSCHRHMGHSQEEEQKLFLKTLEYLYNLEYEPMDSDFAFITAHAYLVTEAVKEWLKKL